MHVLLLSAAVLLAICHLASAAFGPETTTTMNTQFVTVYSPSVKLSTLGVIVSKRYFIVHDRVASFSAASLVTYFGDTTNGVNLGLRTTEFTGQMPFGVVKFCHSNITGYNALSFADADQIDFSKNNSASIFYWRPSTNTFFSRTAMAPAETFCPQGAGGKAACLEKDFGANSCKHMYDSVAGNDDTAIFPWIIIDGKAAGYMDTTKCVSGRGNASSIYEFIKIAFYKADLFATGAVFERK